MKQILSKWLGRYLGNEEAVCLGVMMIVFIVMLATVGEFLGPVFASMIIAFLLQGVCQWLGSCRGVKAGVSLDFIYFVLCGLVAIVIGIVHIVGRQLSLLLGEVPSMIGRSRDFLIDLPERYADYVTAEQFDLIWVRVSQEVANVAEQILSFSLSSFPSLFAVALYLLLVPVLVFFMLSDRENC